MNHDVYPLLCLPHIQPRIWGGQRLAELYGKPLPAAEAIGETWEVADLPEGTSTIGNGPMAGQTLGEAVAAWGAELVGTAWPAGRFPLLVKFLDAQDNLSVQVHPSDEDCAACFPEHHGKDESWIIIAAEPGGSVMHGVRDGVTWAELSAAIADETVLDRLRRIEVAPGDVLRVAPGVIHALGRGVVVLEIQQPSDSTFRLFDYGRGRQLHLAESERVIRYGDVGPACLDPEQVDCAGGTREVLVDVPAYRIERVRLHEAVTWAVDPRSVQTVIALEGEGVLAWAGGELAVRPGDAVLVPAAQGEVTFRPAGEVVLVIAGAGGVPLVEARG